MISNRLSRSQDGETKGSLCVLYTISIKFCLTKHDKDFYDEKAVNWANHRKSQLQ
jgi:hypothetical protein